MVEALFPLDAVSIPRAILPLCHAEWGCLQETTASVDAERVGASETGHFVSRAAFFIYASDEGAAVQRSRECLDGVDRLGSTGSETGLWGVLGRFFV